MQKPRTRTPTLPPILVNITIIIEMDVGNLEQYWKSKQDIYKYFSQY